MNKIAGVDYGSKMAGTTVIAIMDEKEKVCLYQSEKKRDADKFLHQIITKEALNEIYLDAPLSLPGIFTGIPDCTDYFYRKGDKELRAMSPMFLGALTARAIKFRDTLAKEGRTVLEIYPAALSKALKLNKLGYKKEKNNIRNCLEALLAKYPLEVSDDLENWHQFDALLALVSGIRYRRNEHIFVGDEREGGIIY